MTSPFITSVHKVSFMNLSCSVKKKRSSRAPSDEIPDTNMQRNTLFVYVHVCVCVSECVRTRVCVCVSVCMCLFVTIISKVP